MLPLPSGIANDDKFVVNPHMQFQLFSITGLCIQQHYDFRNHWLCCHLAMRPTTTGADIMTAYAQNIKGPKYVRTMSD